MTSRVTDRPAKLTVYGIRQCDTTRKALKWLAGQGIAYHFHDLREDGLEPGKIAAWLAAPIADRLVNRRSTTWRTLSDAQKQASGKALEQLLLGHPTLIKRPVLERGGEIIAVGFDPVRLEEILENE